MPEGVATVLQFVLVVLLVVLAIGFVAGATAVSSVKGVREQQLRRELKAYKLKEKAREQQAKLAATARKNPPVPAWPIRWPRGKASQPAGSGAKNAPLTNGKSTPTKSTVSWQDKPPTQAHNPAPTQTSFATSPPENDFVPMCKCPQCGWLDTHFLRAPFHPPPPDPAPDTAREPPSEKSWWGSIVGWFEDDNKDAADKPTQLEGKPQKSWWDSVVGWFDDDPRPQDSPEKLEPTAEPTADHPDARVVRTCTSCGHVWAQR